MIDVFLQRENTGYDFGAWHDGMELVGFESLKEYDSVIITTIPVLDHFGIWTIYQNYESDSDIDFWEMTNHQEVTTKFVY